MKRIISLVLSTLLANAIAHAAPADFEAKVIERFPQAEGAKIEKAFDNFYSIIKGGEVVFVDESLSYMVTGDVVNLNENYSVVAKLKEANRPKINLADLKTKDAIKLVRGNGAKKMYVFSDPDCPYCKKLEPEFDQLQNVTIYVFPMPLDSLHPNARKVSEWIWCSKDRATAWHSYVSGKSMPASTSGSCETPIDRNIALAKKMGIYGTPAIIFESGEIIPGLIPVAQIEQKLGG